MGFLPPPSFIKKDFRLFFWLGFKKELFLFPKPNVGEKISKNMNVHLIRSNELPVFKFNRIVEYLNEFKGDINFCYIEEDEIENEQEQYENDPFLIKHTLDDFSPVDENDFVRFFGKCDDYRQLNNISKDELVILLTNHKNTSNFLGYPSKDMKNVFIQVSEWKNILGDGLDETLPIVYEIAAWVLRSLLFKELGDMRTHILPKTFGCVMDMCKDKRDFSFKIRTGDIRPEVIALIGERNINPAYINQLISIFEKIRSGVLFRQRVPITNQLPRLELVPVGNKNKFKLVDFGGIELKLQPMENIIYTIFLLCEDGIRLQYINNHINTVKRVVDGFYPNKSVDYIEELVKKYCSKEYKNLIDSNISHINKKLKLAIPENVLDQYLIQKGKGDKYRISLNRELVDISRL